eukprot:TRINITY_DN5584_c0_g2_i1.p1 TRINITY_DN5584_c0_g2~~TRINITY_DN5584_c0_g2_i1.p1  ORF type:complete len:822 (-),score=171.75 TRINITY_DN5584_c0_g2_i1:323-2722(-)
MPPARPLSAHSQWVSKTLSGLYENSSRGGLLPTPHYLQKELQLDVVDDMDEEEGDAEVDDSAGEPAITEAADGADGASRKRQSLWKLEDLTKSFLPDVNKVLESLRSSPDGLGEIEKDKMLAAFQRYKDPQAPEIHKDELPHVLAVLGYRVEMEKIQTLSDNIVEHAMLEKRDFLTFMENYKASEKLRYKEIFETFDTDQSGELDRDEIVQFIHSLGFTPLRPMVDEALALVDLDRNGSLDFEECVLLLHVFRHSEGFTINEVKEFTHIFSGFDPNHEKKETFRVSPERVSDLLVKFFGPSVLSVARSVQTEALEKASSEGHDAGLLLGAEGVSFQEALLWARRVRDKIFSGYRKAFNEFDEDGSDSIDMHELRLLLRSLGYTLTKRALDQLLIAAHNMDTMEGEQENHMDYDTFVNFMQVLHQTDGFTDEELTEIDAAFDRFDADGSGDIDVVELADILRYMGYCPRIEHVRAFHAQVDCSGDGSLDRREFVAFMRLRRESELRDILAVFDEFKNAEAKIPQSILEAALQKIMPPPEQGDEEEDGALDKTTVPHIDFKSFVVDHDVDFDELVDIFGKMRDARAAKLRQFAGYSDAEVAQYREMFDSFDTQKTGILTAAVLPQMLSNLGHHTTSVKDQQEMKETIAAARAAATEDGIDNAHEAGINFWVMLKVLRSISRKKALADEKQLHDILNESKFTTKEVGEFQDVFDRCWENNLAFEGEEPTDTAEKTIPVVALVRLIRSMGLKMETKQRTQLSDKFEELTEGNQKGDFFCFLKIMHWMMSTNFCNINSHSQQRT